RPEDAKVTLVWKQRLADDKGHERDQQHRQADDRHVVTEERAPVHLRVAAAPQEGVLDHVRACQQEPERHEAADRSDQHALERIGSEIVQKAEVEHRPEEVLGEPPFRALGEPPSPVGKQCSVRLQPDLGHVRHGCIRSRICRATGVKSSWPVVWTKTSSSDSARPSRNAAMSRSAAMRPFDKMTTREHSFSTMSKRCVLNNTMRSPAANRRSSVRNSRLAVTSRPENGSSRTRRSGLCINAAANSTRWRIPFEYAAIV